MSVNVSKTKYILFRPRGQKILHNLDENGIIYNSNEIGGIDDKSKIFKLGRIHNEHANINDRRAGNTRPKRTPPMSGQAPD